MKNKLCNYELNILTGYLTHISILTQLEIRQNTPIDSNTKNATPYGTKNNFVLKRYNMVVV